MPRKDEGLPDPEREALRRAASATGPLLAYGGDGAVTLQDGMTGEWLGELRLPTQSMVECLAFDDDRRTLYAGTHGSVLAAWTLSPTPARRMLKVKMRPVRQVTPLGDGRLVVSRTSRDGAVAVPGTSVHDAATLKHLWSTEAIGIGSFLHAVSPDASRLLVQEKDAWGGSWRVECRDLRTYEPLWHRTPGCRAMTWIPGTDWIACADPEEDFRHDMLRLVSASDGTSVGTPLRMLPRVAHLAATPDGSLVVARAHADRFAWGCSVAGLLADEPTRLTALEWEVPDSMQVAWAGMPGFLLVAGRERAWWVTLPGGLEAGSVPAIAAHCVAVSPA